MIDDACRNDLVQRNRQGRLSRSERVALQVHLESCLDCRIAYRIGQDFDSCGTVDERDAARLERLTHAAERWTTTPRRLKRPNHLRLLLAAMSVSLAAAAATVGYTQFTQNALPATQDSSQHLAFPRPTAISGAPNAVASAPASVLEKVPQVPGQEVIRAAPESTRTARPLVALTAEQLLARATQERRSGNVNECIRLFRRLQREFPSSREAGLSLVALGTVLLEQGQATSALEQFNRYLASSQSAALVAEALYGKGRALARLGRLDDEQTVWRRLLAEFPKSPYAAHAKRRLATRE